MIFDQKYVKILRTLGSGNQGNVYLIEYKEKRYVMKLFSDDAYHKEYNESDRIIYDEALIDSKIDSQREYTILKKLGCHPHLPCIRGRGLWRKGIFTFYTIIQDYDEGYRDLSYWRDTHTLNESDLITITSQLMQTIKYVHGKGVAHQDIKLENILYNHDSKNIVLIDFSGSCFKRHKYCQLLYTADYVPDFIENEEKDLVKRLRNRDVSRSQRELYANIKSFDYFAIGKTLEYLNSEIRSLIITETSTLLMERYSLIDVDYVDM